ncbi:hypothetical protein HPO96_05640 [Kribbella sandramycini]|uniref:Uncharacterized protein n=1 Tax=Kribbella sandramycini TaxID=60450 RepID=A0A7Y4NXB8_9ACTN|nr:hypothetical protein [Kribbella sandramycini]
MGRSPEADLEPVWIEPPIGPDVAHWEHRLAAGQARMVKRIAITAFAWLITLMVEPILAPPVAAIGAVLSYVLPVARPRRKIKAAWAAAMAEREAQYHEFLREHQQWHWRVAAFDEGERLRWAGSPRWHPIQLDAEPSRVDVFGGTGDGWASLLATLGSSLIESGAGITVLDLSERYVAGGLADFVAVRGGRVAQLWLPADLAALNVFAGLAPEETADLLAQAVSTLQYTEQRADVRTLTVDLLDTVAGALVEAPTFARLTAGLDVLRRTYDGGPDGPLTAAEISALTARVDLLGQSERTQQTLQHLSSTLNLLGKDEQPVDPDADPASIWLPRGLTIVTTSSLRVRRKEILDRVVFQRLLRDIRHQRADRDGILVVAGADHLGLDSIESLTQEARRSGVRLVLLFERLRNELKEVLGSSDSAAIVMRMGNAQDAAAAAEFIGREHKVVLSQLTEQIGKTFTTGTARSTGGSDGTSTGTGRSASSTTGWSTNSARSGPTGLFAWADNRSSGRGTSGSSSVSESESFTESRSRSWQDTVNRSEADSSTEGRTHSRVYESIVEPTTIQSLPPTAFLLIEAAALGRRVVTGDCNPGIALLDRVAPTREMAAE